MRTALVVTPLVVQGRTTAPGSLDGDVIRARLPLDDAGFGVIDLDPAVDLAEQIDLLFDQGDILSGEPVLFYASCDVMQSVDGEVFLCLDPSAPDTGDSLHDLALLFNERATGPVGFILECWHGPIQDDPFPSASIVAAVREAVSPARLGIELLVAAQLRATDAPSRVSPLTRALIESLDAPSPMEGAADGLTIERCVAWVRDNPDVAGIVPCFAHVHGREPFELLRPRAVPAEPPSDAAVEGPPPQVAPEDAVAPPVPAVARLDDPTAPAAAPVDVVEVAAPAAPAAPVDVVEVAAPAAPAAAVVEGPPPYRAALPSEPIELTEADTESIPPPPPIPASTRVAAVAVLPEQRTFARPEPTPPPRVVVSVSKLEEPPPIPRPPSSVPSIPRPPSSAPSRAPSTMSEHVASGDALRASGDMEGALSAFKRALGMLPPGAAVERAEIYVRQGRVKQQQDKRREAIAAYEKALGLLPQAEGPGASTYRTALAALLELNVAEGDWRSVAATEERVLATVTDADQRFNHLMIFGARWQDKAADPARARAALERARDLRPDDLGPLTRLCSLYEQAGAVNEAITARRRVAELTREPRAKAQAFFDLGRHCLFELHREALGLELLDLALAADPTMLEPLAVIARVLAERQEWSELEQAYRRMLERVDHIPKGEIRSEVTWELCRRLGVTFRDHLDDPALALDAFEDAVHAKPNDLTTRLTAAQLARSLDKNDRAVVHLEAAAAIEPARPATFHELFELFQRLRRPDQAYLAAAALKFLRQTDERETFVYEEHKPQGVPSPLHALRPEAWEWLRPHDRDPHAEAILAAIAPAAITTRVAQLSAEGRLPVVDQAGRQDPEKSTISIVRSFAWASHFLGVAAPAIFLVDDPALGLASVIQEEPTVLAGHKVARGRSLSELAFLVGRHLAYHVGSHRMLLYFPSMDELSACFLAAVRQVLLEVPVPQATARAVAELERGIALRLTEAQRVDLAAAVAAFESAGSRANLSAWAASVELCATRAGYLLAGDIEVVAGVIGSEPRGLLDAEAKVADILGFTVSDEHRALREALGLAITD